MNGIVKPKTSVIFQDLVIYVEIYNNNIDQSDLLDDILKSNGAMVSIYLSQVSKKLVKNVNYIVFKQGKNKTIQYGLANNIPVVNPLWVHDSIMNGELQKIDTYKILKTYTDIEIEEKAQKLKIKKTNRTPQDVSLSKENTSSQQTIDKSNLNTSNNNENSMNKNKIYKPMTGIQDKLMCKELNQDKKEDSNKNNTKITNFFKSAAVKGNSSDGKELTGSKSFYLNLITKVNKEDSTLIKVSSLGLNEVSKFKIINCFKRLGKYKYIGDDMLHIKESDMVIINTVYTKNDIKFIYCLIHNKPLYSYNFISYAQDNNCYPKTNENYLVSYPVNIMHYQHIEQEQLPLNKFKIFIHSSLYANDVIKQTTLCDVVNLITGKNNLIKDNIRQADLCIINKENPKEYFPGHVILVNVEFIFDCLFNLKQMDLNNFKYFPERIIKAK